MVEQGASTLPVVISAIGAFGGGALVGAFANHILHARTERRQERQERKSLLFLVLVEMLSNDTTARRWAKPLKEAERQGHTPKATPPELRTAIWDDARIRLAYLVPPEDFYRVIRYYHAVLRWKTKPPEEALDYFREGILPRTDAAIELIVEEYLLEELSKGFIQEYEEELKRFGQRSSGSEPREARENRRPTDTSPESPAGSHTATERQQ